MLITLLTVLHIIVCLILIVVVLLQSGKAADLAGAFGGMGSQTAFGPRGAATLLSKATTAAAVVFMLTSLTLALIATRQVGGVGSVLEQTNAPATPGQKQGQAPTVPGQPNKPVTNPNQIPTQNPPAQPQQQQPANPAPPAGPKQ